MTTATPTGFETIRAPSLVDQAHRQIRAQILTGDLKPGAPLRDSVLAESMGISRSPVREALRLLEQSGLVEKSANRSYRITDLAAADVPELAALRAADEVLAVRTIVQNRVDISSLGAIIERMRVPDLDTRGKAEADALFHSAVVALAGLPRLDARFGDLTDQIRLVLIAGGLEQERQREHLAENHELLLDGLREALASGSAHEIVRVWEDHVLSGMTVPGLLDPL